MGHSGGCYCKDYIAQLQYKHNVFLFGIRNSWCVQEVFNLGPLSLLLISISNLNVNQDNEVEWIELGT